MYCNGKHRFEVFSDCLVNKKLPKEVLIRIFSYLDLVSLCRCAQVCRYWNVLALDGSNWKRIDLFSFQVDVQVSVVENISRRSGGFLKSLSLKGCQWVTDSALQTFAQQCNNIEHLNLQECRRISDSTCHSLSKYCANLSSLNLKSTRISNISLKYLADGCTNLRRLNISWCLDVSQDGVEALTNTCRLTHFIAKGCSQINNESVIYLARKSPTLEVINLGRCELLSDQSICKLAESCPQLRYICLSGCTLLRDQAVHKLALNCPLLETLEVSGCISLTDAGFQALSRNCRLLEKLDLEDCVAITDTTVISLAQNCPRLETLTLSHCELITDDAIRHLGNSACSAERLCVLELDNCPLVTDQSLEYLQGCHNLQRVELYDCQMVSRAAITRLQLYLPSVNVHAYFAPHTPVPMQGHTRRRYCKCCNLI